MTDEDQGAPAGKLALEELRRRVRGWQTVPTNDITGRGYYRNDYPAPMECYMEV